MDLASVPTYIWSGIEIAFLHIHYLISLLINYRVNVFIHGHQQHLESYHQGNVQRRGRDNYF